MSHKFTFNDGSSTEIITSSTEYAITIVSIFLKETNLVIKNISITK
jgi:hypothetical protein